VNPKPRQDGAAEGTRRVRERKAVPAPPSTRADLVLGTADTSLLDVVDNALTKGVVLTGDLTIALAQVDLIYARLSLLLCAADRVLPHEDSELVARRRQRREARRRHGRA
jgi:hypothetical protein